MFGRSADETAVTLTGVVFTAAVGLAAYVSSETAHAGDRIPGRQDIPYSQHNAGLRRAEYMNPTRVRLHVGPVFGTWKMEEKYHMYQVVSCTDEDFIHGVGSKTVTIVSKGPDGTYPAGWQGPRFDRHVIDMILRGDRPMKPGHRYWVRLTSAIILGFTEKARYIVPQDARPEPGELEPRYGIREMYMLSPRALHLVTGPGIDVERLKDPTTVAVVSKDDAEFAEPVHPEKIGRRSNLDFYIPMGWPWQMHQRHELFLLLPRTLKQGKTYTVDLNAKRGSELTCGKATATITVDDRRNFNLAIKVNQYGYLPDTKEKYAYLGMWMGDLNAYDFSPQAKTFQVRDAATHKVVHTGEVTLRRKATFRLEGGRRLPEGVRAPETVHKLDLSYEDVYQMDLSPLDREGAYYVAIPGAGRSFGFRIAPDIYVEPWKITMNGIFHQRCGIAFKKPYSKHFRPACHRNNTEYSTAPANLTDMFKRLPEYATDGRKHDLYGGHHDAGDHPKTQPEVVDYLFLLYELNKGAFTDGQLSIPENNNGIPDVLDEAWWQLDLWNRLQDPDGGVRAWVETAGDMHDGETQDNDTLREFAFRKEANSSYWFAANAAHAFLIYKGLGRPTLARGMLKRALRAWNWARQHPDAAETVRWDRREEDRLIYAAAMLLHATGDRKYDEAFRRHSLVAKDPNARLYGWTSHNQVFGSFYYAMWRDGDAALIKGIVASFEKDLRWWIDYAKTTNYRYMASVGAPNNWGTGGLPKWLTRPAMACRLTSDSALRERGRQWIILTCDFSLGCHPMNLVFTVRLGQRYVTHGRNILQQLSPEGYVAGFQSEGPGKGWKAGDKTSRSMSTWPQRVAYPLGPWPDLYSYADGASPGLNEGITSNQARCALPYGLLMPPVSRREQTGH